MKNVFLVRLIPIEYDDPEMIMGIYSSRKKALQKLKDLSDEIDYVLEEGKDFEIDEWDIDNDPHYHDYHDRS